MATEQPDGVKSMRRCTTHHHACDCRERKFAEMAEFIRDVRDNYDCDEAAHRHGTRCRCCEAAKILTHYEGSESR